MEMTIDRIKDNNELPEMVNKFNEYMLSKAVHKSLKTVESYTQTLKQFFKFLKINKGRNESNKAKLKNKEVFEDFKFNISKTSISFIREINIKDLNAYIEFCDNVLGNSVGTIGTKIATLKSFYKFLCIKAKVVEHNIASELDSVKPEKTLPKHLTLEETNTLLDSAWNDDSKFAIRDYCILKTFISCGMRNSELVSIDMNKIKFSDSVLTVIGKGNKPRTIYLNETCIDAINDWIHERNKIDFSRVPEKDRNALFISNNYRRLSCSQVRKILEKYLVISGIDNDNIVVHSLRHSAATLMYKYGKVDILTLQNILGHENISTTQIYTHVDDESLHTAVKNNPTNIKRVREVRNTEA